MKLAACIKRASRYAKGDESSTSEIYWHTREAVFEMSRVEHGSFCKIIANLDLLTWTFDKELAQMSEEYWPQVASPII